jgi:RHS repeat-associated protein
MEKGGGSVSRWQGILRNFARSDIYRAVSWLVIITMLCSFAPVGFTRPAHADPAPITEITSDLSVGNYAIISTTRVGRTLFEFTCRATVTNPTAKSFANVRASLSSRSSATTVVDGELTFGDVRSGAAVASQDTFTIRQDRTATFNESDLVWTVRYDVPPNLPPNITSTPVTSATAGLSYGYDVDAADPNPGDVITYSLATSPSGMVINGATGLVTWTPADTQVGSQNVSVRAQDPDGLSAVQNFTITVAPRMVPVPNIVGSVEAAAKKAIASAGLTVGTVATANSATVPAGNVISQNPAAGTSVAAGSAVSIVVSLGPAMVSVPNVVGSEESVAKSAITTSGLTVGTISSTNSVTVQFGNVISQNPAAGTSVTAGSPVNLVVSLGPAIIIVPNVVGLAEAAAKAAITSAGLTAGNVTTANSATVPAGNVISQNPAAGASVAEGSPVDLVVSSGTGIPVLVSINVTPADLTLFRGQSRQYKATGVYSDSTTQDITASVTWNSTNSVVADINAAGLVTATDTGTSTIQATTGGITGGTGLTVQAAALVSIVVTPASPVILVGQSQSFKATGILTDGTSKNLTGSVSWISSDPAAASINSTGTATGTGAGSATITATSGSISGSVQLTVNGKVTDTTPPTAAITSPANNATLTSRVDIIGTANDANFLKYVVEIATAGQSNFTTIAGGTSPVVNGTLGSFDPTLLINDLYTVRLTVYDEGGNQSSTSVVYNVTQNQKVGLFSLTFQDLSIPMVGLPIIVNRVYDSRDKGVGDFGFGWRLDIQTLRARTNRVQGTGWRVNKSGGFLPTYSLAADDQHYVSITLPDGKVEEFDLTPTPTSQQVYPLQSLTAAYTPRSGTLGTLRPLGNSGLIIMDAQPGPVTLLDDSEFDTYNPQSFQYTSADGRIFVINVNTGVQGITDWNGNTLTIGSGGIIHSSGKSVTFSRDGAGRITRITDPNGNFNQYSYDSNGDLASHTDPLGNVTRFFYNLSHGLIEIRDPRGISSTRSEYDADGRIIAHVDAQGNRIEYTHNVGSRQEIVRDRNGNVTLFNYDDRGNVLSKTDPLGNTTSYTYDARNNKLSETDPLGNTTLYTYDGRDNLLTQTDPLGNVTTFTYNSRNQKLTVSDPLGHVTTNTYDAKGNLLTTKDPLGNVTTSTYDAKGNLLTAKDPLGNVTTYTYDTNGNRVSQTDPLGNVITYAYDSNGNQLTETRTRTDENGAIQTVTTISVYDAKNRVIERIDALGNSSKTEYNQLGKELAVIDKNGNRVEFAYDDRGYLTSKTYADGTKESYTYDAEGNKLSFTNRAGRTTGYEYDNLKNLTRTLTADGATASTEYDTAGRPTAVVDPRGNRTQYEYDNAGRKTGTVDPLGNRSTYTYDASGNQTSFTDANGNTVKYAYDEFNRKVKTTFVDGTFSSSTYDILGREVTRTDQAGITTRFAYDGLGHLIKVTDALGGETGYTYDETGNKITQTDANGHVTKWSYDNAGRIKSRTLPLGMSERFTYDASGNTLSRTDFAGNTIANAYDSNNRLLSKTYPGGTGVTFTYTPTGKRKTETDSRGTATYSYDARDRLLQVVNADGSTVRYSYDSAGNRTSVTVPSGTTTYGYDALNRPATVTDPAGGVSTYSYNKVGNRQSVSYPNGTSTVYTYDALNRLTKLENLHGATVIGSHIYTLGAMGNRTGVAENGGRTVAYTYDNLYRLTREDIKDPALVNRSIAYTYDAVGNRLTKTVDGATTNYNYDNNDRLINETGITYTYDLNGSLTSKTDGTGTTGYSYDYDNRLIKAVSPTETVTYAYDADGNRVESATLTDTVRYLVDTNRELPQVLVEYKLGGMIAASYVYGDDLLHMTRNGQTSYYHFDGLGSTRLLTSDAGIVTDTYAYDAFGNLIARTGTTDNPFLFTGQKHDSNTGFYYLRARYYQPSTGRFTAVDPYEGDIYAPATLHKYLYAANDPVNKVDPNGEFFGGMSEVMLSLSVRAITFSIRYPTVTGIIMTVLRAIIPFEVEMTCGPSFGNAIFHSNIARDAGSKGLKFLSEMDFQKYISEMGLFRGAVRELGITKDGFLTAYMKYAPKGGAIIDFIWKEALIEIKMSAKTIDLDQARVFIAAAERNGLSLHYWFLNNPLGYKAYQDLLREAARKGVDIVTHVVYH